MREWVGNFFVHISNLPSHHPSFCLTLFLRDQCLFSLLMLNCHLFCYLISSRHPLLSLFPFVFLPYLLLAPWLKKKSSSSLSKRKSPISVHLILLLWSSVSPKVKNPGLPDNTDLLFNLCSSNLSHKHPMAILQVANCSLIF